MLRETKENVQGTNSDAKETGTQINGVDQKEETNIQPEQNEETRIQKKLSCQTVDITCFIYDIFQLKVMLLYVDVNIDLVFCSLGFWSLLCPWFPILFHLTFYKYNCKNTRGQRGQQSWPPLSSASPRPHLP